MLTESARSPNDQNLVSPNSAVNFAPSEIELARGPQATAPVARVPLTRTSVEQAMEGLLAQKNYPCIAALKSFHKKDFEIGTYGRFGTGQSWQKLRQDLLKFVEHQKKTHSIYLTFFAAFEAEEFEETEFEAGLWNELSHLTSVEERPTDWIGLEHADPQSKDFRFSLGGTEFFVVGLHTQSSREARRFPFPLLIFNVFAQFEELERLGLYENMIKTNRERDLKFQGSVNPMVEQHGDQWEPIQFSGKSNPDSWKCPFHFVSREEKIQAERAVPEAQVGATARCPFSKSTIETLRG